MMSGAISHSILLLLQVDGISSTIENLATIIRGLLTLGKVSKAMGPRSRPMQDNLGEDLGAQSLPQGGLNRTPSRLE